MRRTRSCAPTRTTSVQLFLDEDVLRAAGVRRFRFLRRRSGTRELLPDMFV